MEEKNCFKFCYKDESDDIITLYASYGDRNDFFPGMRVDDYFCIEGGFGVINRGYNLEYVLRCFDEPERLILIPCGLDIIFCLDEDKEIIQQNIWKILKRLKNDNCFFWAIPDQVNDQINN